MLLTAVTAVRNAIAAGNHETLIRCVESVAALKTPHEHLIYDGASTDGTVELLRELEAKTPSLKVVSEPDTGIYNALNKGVRDAKGEWFYVLGSDDYISHPEIMDALLSEYDCDEIVTPVEMEQGTRKPTVNRIFFATPYCHQGTIQKTSVIRRFGAFDERFSIAADYDLILKIHEAGSDIKYVDSKFAYFGGNGLSSTFTNRMHAEFNEISAAHFMLSIGRVAKMRKRGRISLSLALSYFFNMDLAFRGAARHAVYDDMKDFLRIVLYPIVIAKRKIQNKRASTIPRQQPAPYTHHGKKDIGL